MWGSEGNSVVRDGEKIINCTGGEKIINVLCLVRTDSYFAALELWKDS